MSSQGYQPLPTGDDDDESNLRNRSHSPLTKERARSRSASPTHRALHRALAADRRFDRPAPATWKRVALLLFLGLMFYVVFAVRKGPQVKVEVVHAQRYSKEFKYRPAASPIITERLKDGRKRIRGAVPEGGVYQPAQPY